MTPAQRLGVLLSDLRAQRGLTQEQVAEAAGISRNHLQLLELGLSNRDGTPANPRLSTLQGLATVLGTDVPALVSAAFTDDYDTVGIEQWDAEPLADLLPELDTSDPDVLATLLQRAFSEAETAEFLEALVQIGGSLPAGAIGGHIPEGEYDVRLSESVCKTLRALDAKAATRTRRTKVDKALKLLREVGPSHPSLQTHRYGDLDRAVGVPVWQSNAETAVPNAWRMWWWYEGGDARSVERG